jgi:hypothetical protein
MVVTHNSQLTVECERGRLPAPGGLGRWGLDDTVVVAPTPGHPREAQAALSLDQKKVKNSMVLCNVGSKYEQYPASHDMVLGNVTLET